MPIGAHMSISGGLELAFKRIRRVGGKALQIFTRNQRQWTAKPISEEEARSFAAAWREWGEYIVASHDSYLINLASPKAETVKKSVTTLALELERSEMLGIPYVVMHPGAHLGEGVEAGLKRFVANLDEVFYRAREGALTGCTGGYFPPSLHDHSLAGCPPDFKDSPVQGKTG